MNVSTITITRDHADADYSGFVKKSSKPSTSAGTIARGGVAMAKIFSEPSESDVPSYSFEPNNQDGLIGGDIGLVLGKIAIFLIIGFAGFRNRSLNLR